jgi:excisionase family DNA binding protein
MDITPKELAAMLNIHIGTLANWRSKGIGPSFSKIGHKVRYSKQDVQKWIKKHEVKQ